jgi:DNA polymerase-1
MLLKILENHAFTHWALVLDSPVPTFRHILMPSYKSQRKTPPEALIQQFSYLPLLCESFGIPYLVQPGFEADDVIASYAKWGLQFAQNVCLVSSDKDLMQVITPRITMYDPIKEIWIQEAGVETRWGVLPHQIPDVQALAGDSSDHIPGVPGIGPKTAALWVKEAGHLEAVLSGAIPELSAKKRELLITHQDQARLCYRMARLKDDLDIPHTDVSYFQRKLPDPHRLETFLDHMELRRVKRRVLELGWLAPPPAQVVHVRLWQPEDLKDCSSAIYIAWIVSPDNIYVGALLRITEHLIVLVPCEDFPSKAWQHFWHDTQCTKIVWDGMKILRHVALPWTLSLEDIRLLEYNVRGCHSSPTALQTIARAGSDATLLEATFSEDTPELLLSAALLQEAYYGLEAYTYFLKHGKKDLTYDLYHTLDLPALSTLHAMEQRGIKIDLDMLHQFSKALTDALAKIETDIYHSIGHPINLASPKQLGEVLFQELQWPVSKKGKSGNYSTASDVLEAFSAQGYPLAQQILDWRHYAKLKQGYTDALPAQVSPETGRIHTEFSMVTTSTGRLSSLNPNLQHIPISEAFPIRNAFRPAQGCVFLSLDYSQIELRLLAHMGEIPALIEAFHKGHDVHEATAQAIFQTQTVTVHQRKYAKTINFGVLYGMSPFGLAKQLHISPKEAEHYIKRYFELYPGVQSYMDRVAAFAQEHGYVHTLWGRKCTILDIHNASSIARQSARRQAINAPLQGTCADFMKKAMVESQKILPLHSYLLLQIHDELLFEIPQDQVSLLIPRLQHSMEHVETLLVPLHVNVQCLEHW